MGGIDSWFDELDEVKVSVDGYGQSQPTNGVYYGDYKPTRLLIMFIFHIYSFFYFYRYFFTLIHNRICRMMQLPNNNDSLCNCTFSCFFCT